MQRILYLMQKEFRQIFREKANLVIIFLMPIIQLLILGFAITTDVKNIATVVVDQDKSVISRKIIDKFSVTKTFNYFGLAGSVKQAIRLLDLGETKLIIVIPRYFARDLKTGRKPGLQIILDGVDGNSAGIINGYTSKIMSGLQQEWLTEFGSKNDLVKKIKMVNIVPRMLYNPQLESQNNIIPGIIAVLLTMVTLFLTTINIIREKEIGTLEQLSVTPIKKHELILGKILPFALLGFILFNIGLLAGGVIFGVWLKGNLLLLYFMSLLYMLTTLGLGIFFSTVASTQQQAIFFAWFFSIFAIMLSGFFIPIDNMPKWIQILTYFNPTRYFMEVIRGIVLKSSGLVALLPEVIGMTVFGTTILVLSILRFHKRVS